MSNDKLIRRIESYIETNDYRIRNLDQVSSTAHSSMSALMNSNTLLREYISCLKKKESTDGKN